MFKKSSFRNHKVEESDSLHTFYDISFYINCFFIPVALKLGLL